MTSLDPVRALYISYFGLKEPLVQTQVLPYLRELSAAGAKMFLLTFEPQKRKRWTRESIANERAALRADGIEWFSLAYHKRPTLPATLFDIAAGIVRTIALAWRHRLNVLHARAQVPALIGAVAKRFTRTKLVFDVRGLMADEYTEAGRWKSGGRLYRTVKAVDRFLYRSSDAFVVLTEKLRQALFANEAKPVEVIPCCIDPARFMAVDAGERARIRAHVGATDDHIVLVYLGSLGGMYLDREMAEVFAAAKKREPRVFPLILTHSNTDALKAHLQSLGFRDGDVHFSYIEPRMVPAYLAASDVGVSMIKPGYSKMAASPTKFAEYLAAGLPVLSNRGMGDMDAQITEERVGVLINGFDMPSYEKAFDEIQRLRAEPGLKNRCRAFAFRAYDLQSVGGVRYRRLYGRLLNRA